VNPIILSSCILITDIFTVWLVCVWTSVLVCQDLVVVRKLVVCFGDYTSECKLVCTGFVCVS